MPGSAQRRPTLGRLQATTLARQLGRVFRFGAPSGWFGAPSVWDGWWPPHAASVVAAGRREVLPDDLKWRYDALLDEGARVPGGAAVVELALAGGTPLDAIAFLARTWPELTDRDRQQVAAPLRPAGAGRQILLGDAPARQTDSTTCGSAVLAMLAVTGDPLLALWLVTGRRPDTHPSPEVRALSVAERAAPDAAARFAAVQRAVKRMSNGSALGPLPWPGGLGTPPWGAARAARYPGATFRSVMIDDTDTRAFGALLDRADRALAAGVPVPLFTGGDLASGLTTVVPRHVVLLTPGVDLPGARSGRYAIFEPAGGAVHDLTRAELLAPAGARAALGGWSHACWAVLPRA